jgi:hypothetical protein
MNKRIGLLICVLLLFLFWGAGCATSSEIKPGYSDAGLEAQWIRDGQPLEFENEWWYPTDFMETFLTDEVYPLGEYKGVQFFADKADVRPYQRLYTRFSRLKYRVFEKANKGKTF